MLYNTYLCIGGMPSMISDYLNNNKDLMLFDHHIGKNILIGYLADMAKYADNINTVKINKVYNSIPEQLAKENTKFSYKLVEQGGKKEKFETAIEWLIQASMLLGCVLLERPQIPLSAYKKENMFKLYCSDTGLLTSLANIKFKDIMQTNNMQYRGFLTENYVAQHFVAGGQTLYYWNSGNKAEIDFLLDANDGIIPCEVKASDHVRSRSLGVYVEKFNPPYSIRISQKNFGFENNIKSIPLYAVFCIFGD
jgi:predicted AAA+ superfamily ATPase